MTIGVTTKVTIPKIDIKTPEEKRFWKAVGLEAVKDIRKRTQAGKDADNKAFKPYKKATAVDRAKRGRSSKVNLTDSGRMLGSMVHGIRARKGGVWIKLSGRQGFKAWNIKHNQRRNFFALNDKQVKKVIKLISKWIAKKNK